jgi:hypothetical protein
MKNYFLILFVLGVFAYACTDQPIGSQPSESVPPGPISNVKVLNTPGGAILTYTLPSDEDLLYIKAIYTLKDGVKGESRASMYTDTLKVAGFGDILPREVTLIAVDRSRNESAPVKVTINPLEPSVITIGKNIILVSDFGGVHAYWSNPTRAEVTVVLLKENNNKEFVPLQTFYSTMEAGEGAKRGMDTIPVKFGIYVQDRWSNRSEIKYFTLTPIYETKFDRLKFREVKLPNDEPAAWGWVMPRLWDNIIGDQGFHTGNGTGRWPHAFTIDLGITGKLSRIIEWQRQGTWIYMHGNLKKFEVYGTQTLDPTGNWANWTLLMTCNSIKPSGLPVGQVSAEDKAWAAAGEEFINSPMNPKVRYIRIKALQSWSDGDFLHLSELQFFGDNRLK